MNLSRRRFLVGTSVGLTAILLNSSIAQATPNKTLQGKFVDKNIYLDSPTDVLSNTIIHKCHIFLSKNGTLNLVGSHIMLINCFIESDFNQKGVLIAIKGRKRRN